MEDKNKKDIDGMPREMDLEELDKLSGGGIDNAKKEKRKDLDDDVTDRA